MWRSFLAVFRKEFLHIFRDAGHAAAGADAAGHAAGAVRLHRPDRPRSADRDRRPGSLGREPPLPRSAARHQDLQDHRRHDRSRAGAPADPRRAGADRDRHPAAVPRRARARDDGAGAGADRRLRLDRQRAGAGQRQRPGRQRQPGAPRDGRPRPGARWPRSRSSCSTPRGGPPTTSSRAWSRCCCSWWASCSRRARSCASASGAPSSSCWSRRSIRSG